MPNYRGHVDTEACSSFLFMQRAHEGARFVVERKGQRLN